MAFLDSVLVLVVPDISSSRDFIVGRPWCESENISFIKDKQQLTFYDANSFPFVHMDVNGVLNKKNVTEVMLMETDDKRQPLTLDDVTVGNNISCEQQIQLMNLLNLIR